jgi:hypothetical protein
MENNNQMQKREVNTNVTAHVVEGRQAQEVQGMVFMAKQYPRDQYEAFNRIMKSCERTALAENAIYQYPRGGTKVTGPSIRLAEALAQNWGNIDFGIMELEQKNGESSVMAYAWDLETNTRQTKLFQVPHVRYSRAKGNEKLTDPRDIYEIVANNGARRLRACILGVIPGDVIDAAVDKCQETLKNGYKEPLEDRIKNMIAKFDKEFSVKKEMLEKLMGYNINAFTEMDVVKLIGIFKSLRDGMAKREDYFEIKADKKAPEPASTKLDGKFKKDEKKDIKKDEKVKENSESKINEEDLQQLPWEGGEE